MKTALLSGDREETRRDVYAEPPQEMRDKVQITREQVLKLETAVYGLRNAPRAWWKRVVRDLTGKEVFCISWISVLSCS